MSDRRPADPRAAGPRPRDPPSRHPRSAPEAALTLTHRLATRADLPALAPLIHDAIEQLQRGFLDPDQIAASHETMGVDARLVDDGTYFLVELGGEPAGCGGWSRRATLYGHSHSPTQDASLLDPATEPARVRAMYTHPRFARRGVGRLILALCEAAAAAEGFTRLELVASLAGERLYAAAGFVAVERLEDTSGPVPVPIVRMGKPIADPPAGGPLTVVVPP